MKKCLQLSFLAVAILVRPTIAAADSLTFTGLGSGAWVTLQLGTVTETGWAGEINWRLNTPTNGAGQAVTTYCADLFDDAQLFPEYGTLKTTAALDADPGISHGAVANAGSIAAYLVNTNAAAAHASNIQAAGLQLAIWQAMFGNTFTVLSSTANYSAIMTAAGGYGLPSGSFSATASYFDVANGPGQIGFTANGQDQVLVGTPEPATVFMLLFAMAAALGYQYRLNRQAVRA